MVSAPRPPDIRNRQSICEVIYLEVLGAGGRGAGERVLEDGARRPPSYFEGASVLETINSRNNISLNCYSRNDISLNCYKRNDISLND